MALEGKPGPRVQPGLYPEKAMFPIWWDYEILIRSELLLTNEAIDRYVYLETLDYLEDTS